MFLTMSDYINRSAHQCDPFRAMKRPSLETDATYTAVIRVSVIVSQEREVLWEGHGVVGYVKTYAGRFVCRFICVSDLCFIPLVIFNEIFKLSVAE
ncbi:hypothetical protein DPMN_091710 [Dreissena polymorpha]|uniref:Uncharacterized protein n=1 Tax=Dreissena polymorpha TaxID=45954 RepID=A0A9D4L2J5_DREPO|nr:hypothetical protein DPMN_091710 [Dreissena polymorpha]